MSILLNGELALSNSVPDLDVLVSATTGNLSVVRGEGTSKSVLGMTNKSSGANSVLKIPKSESRIPGGGQGVPAVLGEAKILDEMGVTY